MHAAGQPANIADMHVTNHPDPIRIGMIGMPRSGSTIMSSLVNSLDGALVVGEPHAMVRAQRPPGMSSVPTIIDTRYGTFRMFPGLDVLSQLETIATVASTSGNGYDIQIVGFKECWVPTVEPIQLLEHYDNRLTHRVVMLRDPEKNYASMMAYQYTIKGVTPIQFTEQYCELAEYALKPGIGIMSYELFRSAPLKALNIATGLEVAGALELKQYAGGGDPLARGSKEIRSWDHREPTKHDDLSPAIAAYKYAMESIAL